LPVAGIDRQSAAARPPQSLTWQTFAAGWHLPNDARRQNLIQALSELDRCAAQLIANQIDIVLWNRGTNDARAWR
jgi:hypothetical protein